MATHIYLHMPPAASASTISGVGASSTVNGKTTGYSIKAGDAGTSEGARKAAQTRKAGGGKMVRAKQMARRAMVASRKAGGVNF